MKISNGIFPLIAILLFVKCSFASDTINKWFISAYYHPQLIEYKQKLHYPYKKDIYFKNGFGFGVQKNFNHGLCASIDLNHLSFGQKAEATFDGFSQFGFDKKVSYTNGNYAVTNLGVGKSFHNYSFLPLLRFRVYALYLLNVENYSDLFLKNSFVTKIEEGTDIYKDVVMGFSFSFQYRFMVNAKFGVFVEPEFISSFGNICSGNYLDANSIQFSATAHNYSFKIGCIYKY